MLYAETLIERWENVLRVLRALTPHQRRKHWDMETFGVKTPCGTVACAAGHCGLDPWFRRRGFKTTATRERGQAHFGSGLDFREGQIEAFFGTRGARDIFFNGTHRSVGQVIKEVKSHIRQLKAESL